MHLYTHTHGQSVFEWSFRVRHFGSLGLQLGLREVAYTSTTTSGSRSREVLDGLHHLVILFDFFVGRIADLSNRQLEFQRFAANFRIKHWHCHNGPFLRTAGSGWVGLPVRQQVALLCMSFLLPDKVTKLGVSENRGP